MNFSMRLMPSAVVPPNGLHAAAIPGGLPTDVSLIDCDELFKAVEGRLHRIADAHTCSLAALRLPEDAQRVEAGVLECMAALEQLQLAMRNERARREKLECELAATQCVLAQAAAALTRVPA